MDNRRMSIIGLGIIALIIFGGIAFWWLINECGISVVGRCLILWGAVLYSILGGVLFTEILFARKKARNDWSVKSEDIRFEKPQFSHSQMWFVAFAGIVLSSLLALLPVIVGGSIVLALSGVITGFCVDGVIRAMFGWLPPLE